MTLIILHELLTFVAQLEGHPALYDVHYDPACRFVHGEMALQRLKDDLGYFSRDQTVGVLERVIVLHGQYKEYLQNGGQLSVDQTRQFWQATEFLRVGGAAADFSYKKFRREFIQKNGVWV